MLVVGILSLFALAVAEAPAQTPDTAVHGKAQQALPGRTLNNTASELVVPIRFLKFVASNLTYQTPFNEPFAKTTVEQMNKFWRWCGIRFELKEFKEVPLKSAANLTLTNGEKQEAYLKTYRRIGKEPGTCVWDGNFRYLTNISAAESKLRKLSGATPTAGEMTSYIVPKTDVMDRGIPPAFTLASLSLEGLREFYRHTPQEGEFDKTLGIVVGIDSDDIRTLPWTMAHEAGHYLGLSHSDTRDKSSTLMTQVTADDSKPLSPGQCEFARNFYKAKVGMDLLAPDGKPCRKHIEGNIRKVDERRVHQASDPPAGREQVERILGAYDQLPDFIKWEMCQLKGISLVQGKGFPNGSTAEVKQTKDDGLELLISQERMEQSINISQFLTWKDQSSFEGGDDPRVPNDKLPRVQMIVRDGDRTWLLYLLLHELGHVIADQEKQQFPFHKLSWGDYKPQERNQLPFREQLFNQRGKPIDPTRAQEVYEGLLKTEFPSTYASTDEYEHFAETFALFMTDKIYGIDYFGMDIPGGKYLDLKKHFNSDALAPQRQFMETLTRRLTEQAGKLPRTSTP